MKPTVVLLVSLLALAATGSVAAAADPVETSSDADEPTLPPWPDDPTANNSSVSPGEQLAGAVGAQGATVEGELWNRTLSDRLDNATTPTERAEVVAEEIDAIEAYVEALEGVKANVTDAWDDGELSEGELRASVSELVVRARIVEMRANRTVAAAENVSPGMRRAYKVNVTHARELANRSAELYEFEDEIARDAANETLADESADGEAPWIGEKSR